MLGCLIAESSRASVKFNKYRLARYSVVLVRACMILSVPDCYCRIMWSVNVKHFLPCIDKPLIFLQEQSGRLYISSCPSSEPCHRLAAGKE